jgi:UDP-2-acetamido-2,6-beta-L-arabino-hexul-4-ose reductase
MMRVGVTGANGFIGRHAVSFLRYLEKTEQATPVILPREAFDSSAALEDFVKKCGVIMHFAGTNRGTDKEIFDVNVGLTKKLIDACEFASATPTLLFSSSMYAAEPERFENSERPVSFGTSKHEAARILMEWGEKSAARVVVFDLPHVFGEFALPFHNSAVATLCHQLARGEASELKFGANVELVYVRDVVASMWGAAHGAGTETLRIRGAQRPLSEIYELLKSMHLRYVSGGTLELQNPLEVALFATLHYHELLQLHAPE